jgi:hypothetical protein
VGSGGGPAPTSHQIGVERAASGNEGAPGLGDVRLATADVTSRSVHPRLRTAPCREIGGGLRHRKAEPERDRNHDRCVCPEWTRWWSVTRHSHRPWGISGHA